VGSLWGGTTTPDPGMPLTRSAQGTATNTTSTIFANAASTLTTSKLTPKNTTPMVASIEAATEMVPQPTLTGSSRTHTTWRDQRTTIIGTALARLAEIAELPSAIRLPSTVSVTPSVAVKSRRTEIWKALRTIATTSVIV